MLQKPLFILSADDDSDDQEFIEEALKSTKINHIFRKVEDGDKLIRLLHHIHNSGSELPDIILLDLNMPVKSGREAIKIIKDKASAYRAIPVVILTTSNSPEDINFCLSNGANSFLVKPNDFTDLIHLLEKTLMRLTNEAFPEKNLN